MSKITDISNAIDSLLDRSKWTHKELAFYQMLISKVRQYRDHLPQTQPRPIRDLSDDIHDILGNIITQPWYQSSPNQGTITQLFSQMKVIECKHQGDLKAHNYQYKLVLKLQDNLHLVMEVVRDPRVCSKPPYHFRIYFELGGVRGHIAAFTPGKTKGHQLPEYDGLIKILPLLRKHEIVCLAIELVLYYDIDGIMAKLPLGNSYPITISQLMDGILQGL